MSVRGETTAGFRGFSEDLFCQDAEDDVHELQHQIKRLEDEIAAIDERLESKSKRISHNRIMTPGDRTKRPRRPNRSREQQLAQQSIRCDAKAPDEYRQRAKRSLFRKTKQPITCPQCHKTNSFDLREPIHDHRCPSCRGRLTIRWIDDSTLAIRPQ